MISQVANGGGFHRDTLCLTSTVRQPRLDPTDRVSRRGRGGRRGEAGGLSLIGERFPYARAQPRILLCPLNLCNLRNRWILILGDVGLKSVLIRASI